MRDNWMRQIVEGEQALERIRARFKGDAVHVVQEGGAAWMECLETYARMGRAAEGLLGAMGRRWGSAESPKFSQRGALGEWAPGEYLCLCRGCLDSYVGDKRSTKCADCAYGATKESDD